MPYPNNCGRWADGWRGRWADGWQRVKGGRSSAGARCGSGVGVGAGLGLGHHIRASYAPEFIYIYSAS